jgi:hypothetical protein
MAGKKYSKTTFYDFDTKSQLKAGLGFTYAKKRPLLLNVGWNTKGLKDEKERYELKGITRKGKIASYLKMEKEIRANLNRR